MPRRRTTAPEPIAILTVYLDQIAHAVKARDTAAIAKLLRRRVSSHMPRDVRDELHGLVRHGSSGFRAPMRFLRYHHRIVRLAEGGESIPGPGSQIEIPWDEAPSVREDSLERVRARRGAKEEDIEPAEPA